MFALCQCVYVECFIHVVLCFMCYKKNVYIYIYTIKIFDHKKKTKPRISKPRLQNIFSLLIALPRLCLNTAMMKTKRMHDDEDKSSLH